MDVASSGSAAESLRLGRILAGEFAKFAEPSRSSVEAVEALPTLDTSLAAFDVRITDDDLRRATRSRFDSGHYADAVEAGIKALNECVRAKSGSTEDGDSLMTSVFSPNKPKLRINRLRSESEKSEQRGHMMLCQGVVAAWRNPRAHSSQITDSPEMALAMLELIQHLMAVTKSATRTRSRGRT